MIVMLSPKRCQSFPLMRDGPLTYSMLASFTPVAHQQHEPYHPQNFFSEIQPNLANSHLPSASCIRRWTFSYFPKMKTNRFFMINGPFHPSFPKDSHEVCRTSSHILTALLPVKPETKFPSVHLSGEGEEFYCDWPRIENVLSFKIWEILEGYIWVHSKLFLSLKTQLFMHIIFSGK